MATLFDPGLFSVNGLSGEILPGTTLGWFVTGTSTPLATYSNQALTVANANPVVVGADGRVPTIWLQAAAYKLVITLPNGTIETRDPIVDSAAALSSDLSSTASDKGAGSVGFSQTAAYDPATLGKKSQQDIDPLDHPYLATGDGSTNDRTAVLTAIGDAAQLSLTAQHNVGSTLTDVSGTVLNPSSSAELLGNIDMEQDIDCTAPLPIHIDSAGVEYDYTVPARRTFAEKGLWLSEGDVTRETVSRIDCTTLLFEKVSWPSADSFTSDTPSSSTADQVEFNASSGNVWYGAFRRARPGQTVRATFELGTYTRGVMMRWSGGYIVLYGSGTSAQVSIKNTGVAVSTSSVSWPGLSDHPQWSMDNAEFGIRVYDLTTVGFLVNGYEVYRATVTGIVHDIGLAVFASGAAVTPAVSWWTETFSDYFAGQQSLSLMIYGDSISAPFASGKNTAAFAGSWMNYLREAIDFSSHGIRVTGWTNYATPGANSATMTAAYDVHGVGVANVVVLFGGTNDVQGGSALSSTEGNFTYLLTNIVAAGRKPLIVIPGLWLNSDQGDQGFVTANAEDAAPMRALLRSLAAQYGALIVDLSQIEGQILEDYYNDTSLADTRKRDRIHPTALAYRVIGYEIAKVIVGHLASRVHAPLDHATVPSTWFKNSWVGTTQAPRVSLSGTNYVEFAGVLDAGTKTDGTAILTLPASLRPPVDLHLHTAASSTVSVNLNVTASTGNVSISGVQAGDSYVSLDALRFQL